MTLEQIRAKYGLAQNDAATEKEDAEIKKKKLEIKKLLLEIKALGAASEKRTGKVNILARGILNTMKA